jgi:hypothetical protein
MTPAQQGALEALVGRPLTADELAALEGSLAIRDDVDLALQLSAMQAPVVHSLPVEDVFGVLFVTGDYLTLKTAQLGGDLRAVLAFSVLADAKALGPGRVDLQSPATVQLLDQLQEPPALLSPAGRAALTARATVPASAIDFNTVSNALNIAEGRLTL